MPSTTYDIRQIKAAVTADPLLFLTRLYGDTVRRSGNAWRVGSKGGRCFDIGKGELLCATHNGDAGQGDCFSVWAAHYGCTFPAAVEQIAGLYGICAGTLSRAALPVPKAPRPDPDALLAERPKVWPLLNEAVRSKWQAAVSNLATNPAAQEEIHDWRGWPAPMVKRLAFGNIIGVEKCEGIPPTLFRVLQPELHRDGSGASFWHWIPVQLHVRFNRKATRRDGTPLTWSYSPTKAEIGATDGGNAPLVLSQFGRDPEQPGFGTRCECVIICAGEWDAITIVVLMDWIDETGILTVPKGLEIVGIRGESRGGTDAFLRWYNHWRPKAAILLADADATGNSWFQSTGNRDCFSEQLKRRGIRVIEKAPKARAGIKDVNDLYRAGLLESGHIAQLLTEAGFPMKGAPK